MSSTPQNIVRTEEADRLVVTGDLDGQRFRIVVAYSATQDAYVSHLYEDKGGQLNRLSAKPAVWEFPTSDGALEHALRYAASKLERRGTFQTGVATDLRPS